MASAVWGSGGPGQWGIWRLVLGGSQVLRTHVGCDRKIAHPVLAGFGAAVTSLNFETHHICNSLFENAIKI